MGRVRIVAPPPENFIPVPLEQTHVSIDVNNDGVIDVKDEIELKQDEESRLKLEEEIKRKDEIAKQIHQDLLKKKKLDEKKKLRAEKAATKTILATRENSQLKAILKKKDIQIEELLTKISSIESSISETALKQEGAIDLMRKEISLMREQKLAAEKARDETLMKYREQSVGQSQLRTKESARIVELETELKETKAKIQVAREEALLIFREEQSRKKETQIRAAQDLKIQNIKSSSTWWSNFVAFVKRKKIELSMAGITNYEAAVIVRTKFAIPKMLDDIERMHEQLAILEEMIAMLEKNKSKSQKENQSPAQ
jgi:hypothetical protein